MEQRPSGAVERQKIVIDTDFGLMNDDCATCLFALAARELEVLGLTIVAGNHSLGQEVANALRVLELVGRSEIPVYAGADRPLLHERGAYEARVWGGWATYEPPIAPLGGFAETPACSQHAADFIVEQIRAHPGRVTIVGIGPLTNLALAVRKDPSIVQQVKEMVIMGGAIPGLPRGTGNLTPTAEFNFWTDPEAARIILRSGLPILLCPLNVTRCVQFKRHYYERIIRARNRTTELFRRILQPVFDQIEPLRDTPHGTSDPAYELESLIEYGICDQITIASILRRDLVRTMEMYVDADTSNGPSYGTSYGYLDVDPMEAIQTGKPWAWTGIAQPYLPDIASGTLKKMSVAYEVDTEAYMDLYIEVLAGAQ